ncbi:unnamed protein product, partial [Discosporangium mesarthrocarpum]
MFHWRVSSKTTMTHSALVSKSFLCHMDHQWLISIRPQAPLCRIRILNCTASFICCCCCTLPIFTYFCLKSKRSLGSTAMDMLWDHNNSHLCVARAKSAGCIVNCSYMFENILLFRQL